MHEVSWRVQLASVAEVIEDGILIVDKFGHIMFADSTAEKILGLDHNDLVGKAYDRLPAPLPVLGEIKNTVRYSEYVSRRSSGPDMVVSVNAGPFRDADNQPVGVVLALRDITGVRNARVFDEALLAVKRLLWEEEDFEHSISAACAIAARAVGADTAMTARRLGRDWVIKYVYGFPAELLEKRLFEDGFPYGPMAARIQDTLAVADIYADDRFSRQVLESYGVRAFLIAPLMRKGVNTGILAFNYARRQPGFSSETVDFVEILAALFSLGIENMLLHETEQRVAGALKQALIRFGPSSDNLAEAE